MARFIGLEIRKCLEWKTSEQPDTEVKDEAEVKDTEGSPCKPGSSMNWDEVENHRWSGGIIVKWKEWKE